MSELRHPTMKESYDGDWFNFTSGANIYSIADDGNYLWIGGECLTRLEKATGTMVFYNQLNSPLPNYYVRAIAIDGEGNSMDRHTWRRNSEV